jgi:hypothetical protein
MIKTKLISAFPGTGKSHYYRSKLASPILDSDSSDFSWIIDSQYNKVRNPQFPNNYIKHIKENLGKSEIIFISSHKEVRDKLVEENLDFYLVYPERGNKQEYIDRYIQRGSPQSFIDLLEKEWDNWITELEEQENCTHIQLKPNEYITDILNNYVI